MGLSVTQSTNWSNSHKTYSSFPGKAQTDQLSKSGENCGLILDSKGILQHA